MKMFTTVMLFVISGVQSQNSLFDGLGVIVNSVMNAVLAPFIGTGNAGCIHNPNCTEYVKAGLIALAIVFNNDNFTVVKTGFTPFGAHNTTITPQFEVTLVEGICSTKIDNMTRRDSGQFQYDNIKIDMDIDLLSATLGTLNVGKTFQNVIDAVPCMKATPDVADLVTARMAPDLFFGDCLTPEIIQNGNDNLTGHFSTIITGLRTDFDYTAHSEGRWIINVADLNLNNVRTTMEICTGSPMFVEACQCLFENNAFITSLLLQTDTIYTCILQGIADNDVTNSAKCPYFE